MATTLTYEQFEAQWLEDIENESFSPFEKGKQFALKLISQWLDFNEDTEDVYFCDGANDGGIDVAYLRRGRDNDENTEKSSKLEEEKEEDKPGDIWYIVQSKYNSSFAHHEN